MHKVLCTVRFVVCNLFMGDAVEKNNKDSKGTFKNNV